MELKETKLEMDDSVTKEIGVLPKDIEEKTMPCTSNFEDHSFHNVEDHLAEDHCVGVNDASSNKDVEGEEEEEVDILECTGFNVKNELKASDCNDGTDGYSSSFGGTDSEHENEAASNDQEADSMICTDTSLPFWVRKKKMTEHWRRFIQPIMWRCKWVELKIKELQNQARMYDKEVEESRQAKKVELETLKSEELGVKAQPPLPCYSQKKRVRERRKRKRVEKTSDVASYALNHNLFSYQEYRKSYADMALNDNSRNLDKKNKSSKEETVFCEETPPLEFREGDAYLEQILLKIEAAKLEARNLKNRVDKVVNENPSKFSSVHTLKNLVGSADVLTSSEQQKPPLVIKNEVEELVAAEEKQAKSASVSSHHDTQPEEDNETADILLSEMKMSVRRREGKAIVSDEKLQKTEQTPVEEGPSRSARKRTPRNLDIVVKEEETAPKRHRVTREKPKSNVTNASSRFKLPNRKRKRGKRRSGSAALRRRT
uniref:Uncharacterized protein n=1 Tax=Noccaea caerulescens TaxID=107243 RepID=A0A1J3CFI0_NOCCA